MSDADLDRRAVEFDDLLRRFLGPNLRELEHIINDVQQDVSQRQYIVEIPDADSVDLSVEELASLVARSSNAYGRAARFAGKCKAESTLAQGKYKRKFEQCREGNNESERRANAMAACEDEHLAMTVAEAAYDYANYLEQSARVASESARKIYDKVANMRIAQGREDSGQLREQDFRPY